MSEKLKRQIAQIYVKWNRQEISGDDAMRQIIGLAKKECHEAWLTDQGHTELGVKAK